MKSNAYSQLVTDCLDGNNLDDSLCVDILNSPRFELLPLLHAAFQIREKFWGREVLIHVINNVQNGRCSEDCRYCAQSASSDAEIQSYPMKSDDEIMEEANRAYSMGADRHCLVFSGFGPASERVAHLGQLVRKLKARFPMEICVSPGVMGEEELKLLKEAGLDRLNHNVNTSERFYSRICSTHSFEERWETLHAASRVGLDICSGVIAGMGEEHIDLVSAAKRLRSLKRVKSIPVNFLIPVQGIRIEKPTTLSPEYCLRVLCLFRFLNPDSEIRAAAGREYYLRSMAPLCFFPANSIFVDGYLNVQGGGRSLDLEMIRDAGFTVRLEGDVDKNDGLTKKALELFPKEGHNYGLKTIRDLHPAGANPNRNISSS